MEIYDVPQLAKMLRTTEPTVRAYLAKGRIVGRKIGGKWLVCDEALKNFLMASEHVGHSTATDNQLITTGA
jgi:excisionase family DNA binding protein